MVLFPEIAPNYGYSCVPVFHTEKLGPTDGDVTQFRQRRSSPLYVANLTYGSLTSANERTLTEFITARKGSYESFTFYDFVSRTFALETIAASANGTQTTWTLDYRDVSAETVYLDGTEAASSTYSISNRTGSDGQDQLVFDTAPAEGAVVTAIITGYLRIPDCHFAEDFIPMAIANWQRHKSGTIKIAQGS